ncbi:MAG: hypothetical protein PVS3B2_01420 [Candidatus Dormibacteraceae bacterium]
MDPDADVAACMRKGVAPAVAVLPCKWSAPPLCAIETGTRSDSALAGLRSQEDRVPFVGNDGAEEGTNEIEMWGG